MKKSVFMLLAAATFCFGNSVPHRAFAQDFVAGHFEYIDIRWDGTDRMCIVHPDGRVDFIGKELEKVTRPDDANKRAFYMTLAVNKMAAQGYEFVSMISDEIVMRRRTPH